MTTIRDRDAEWQDQFGSQETPAAFQIRLNEGTLTEAELIAIATATSTNDAFAILHPEYVSLDDFRETA